MKKIESVFEGDMLLQVTCSNTALQRFTCACAHAPLQCCSLCGTIYCDAYRKELVCAEAKVSIDYRGRPLSEHVPLQRWDFNKCARASDLQAPLCCCIYGAKRYLHRLRMKHGLSWRQVRRRRTTEF
jgi:hypothetical protein